MAIRAFAATAAAAQLAPFEYEPGTWGPPQADALVAEVGGWNTA